MESKKGGSKRALSGGGSPSTSRSALQAGIVLEEDIYHDYHRRNSSSSNEGTTAMTEITADSYVQDQLERIQQQQPAKLFHDADFRPVPTSIDGIHKADQTPKCRCSQGPTLAFSQRTGPNLDRPYYTCQRCKFFQWAYTSRLLHWYRLGPHTGHVLVRNKEGFSAQDLLQGKVGDCWFLSALAVVAERPDLIARLFPTKQMNEYGIMQVRLFVDGFWKTVVLDTFLPCFIDADEEAHLGQAIRASLGDSAAAAAAAAASQEVASSSAAFDPHALCDENRKILQETYEFLEQDRFRKHGPTVAGRSRYNSTVPSRLERLITSNDLAYSKAKHQQLWVPLLEKAYAKVHGCYKAISGGHIAEAFLDLTGAPTVVYDLQSRDFDGRTFWYQLLSYRKRRLPMGCGTSTSQAGIIGMHAYSILDVLEVRNVNVDFFRNELQSGTLGNVSGFTEFDGKVRLLRIRNPHGKGEWKGNFSDTSPVWERLLANERNRHGNSSSSSAAAGSQLSRTMKDDGVFYMDYDSFLMGFSNVDVVLAFEGNHAKSFATSFPAKKSNHRCVRAFEVCLLDEQPGVPATDHVELYVMGIQKNRRGSYHGRFDRKKSYKVCDLGILVGENRNRKSDAFDVEDEKSEMTFQYVNGQMFGFKRNGHYRLTLDRKQNKSLVVMPISFGHPAATDKELSFTLRFVADAPVYIREIPQVPRMDVVLQQFFFGPKDLSNAIDLQRSLERNVAQRAKRILLEDTAGKNKYGEPLFRVYQIDCLANQGGTVFIYLYMNAELLQKKSLTEFDVSLSVEATCRGMNCRTSDGLIQHETVAKGKKFEAAWRRFTCHFDYESNSRLLMTLVQSGQDTEMGTAKCTRAHKLGSSGKKEGASKTKENALNRFLGIESLMQESATRNNYELLGVFNGVSHTESGCAFPTQIDSAASLHGLDATGIEFDSATGIAISQADLELQQALEISRSEVQHSASNATVVPNSRPDVDLEKAIAASLRESGAPSNTTSQAQSTMNDTDTTFSRDLEKALQLSMGMDGHCRSIGATANRVIDLSSSVTSPDRKRKAEVIELVDDEPETGESNGAENKAVAVDDRAEKRRLAAQAALKRLR